MNQSKINFPKSSVVKKGKEGKTEGKSETAKSSPGQREEQKDLSPALPGLNELAELSPSGEKEPMETSFIASLSPPPPRGADPQMSEFTTDLNQTLSDTRMLVNEVVRSSAPPKVHDSKPKTIPTDIDFYIYKDGDPKEENIIWEHIDKLVRYLTLDDIQLEIFGKEYFDQYRALKQAYDNKIDSLKADYPNIKPSSAKFKSILISLPILKRKFYFNGELVVKTFNKLVESLKKYNSNIANNPERNRKKKQAAKLMSLPKRKFIGALLSKLSPEQYRQALQEIDKKGLQNYSALTPARMLKELERRAYMTSDNSDLENILTDRESYKADAFSKGMRNRIKDIEDKPESQRTISEKEAVNQYNTTLNNDARAVSEVRAMLMEGKSPEDIARALRQLRQA